MEMIGRRNMGFKKKEEKIKDLYNNEEHEKMLADCMVTIRK